MEESKPNPGCLGLGLSLFFGGVYASASPLLQAGLFFIELSTVIVVPKDPKPERVEESIGRANPAAQSISCANSEAARQLHANKKKSALMVFFIVVPVLFLLIFILVEILTERSIKAETRELIEMSVMAHPKDSFGLESNNSDRILTLDRHRWGSKEIGEEELLRVLKGFFESDEFGRHKMLKIINDDGLILRALIDTSEKTHRVLDVLEYNWDVEGYYQRENRLVTIAVAEQVQRLQGSVAVTRELKIPYWSDRDRDKLPATNSSLTVIIGGKP